MKLYDKKDEGYITIESFVNILEQYLSMSKKEAEELSKKIKTEKENYITFGNFEVIFYFIYVLFCN